MEQTKCQTGLDGGVPNRIISWQVGIVRWFSSRTHAFTVLWTRIACNSLIHVMAHFLIKHDERVAFILMPFSSFLAVLISPPTTQTILQHVSQNPSKGHAAVMTLLCLTHSITQHWMHIPTKRAQRIDFHYRGTGTSTRVLGPARESSYLHVDHLEPKLQVWFYPPSILMPSAATTSLLPRAGFQNNSTSLCWCCDVQLDNTYWLKKVRTDTTAACHRTA